jgi:hypothetical protein
MSSDLKHLTEAISLLERDRRDIALMATTMSELAIKVAKANSEGVSTDDWLKLRVEIDKLRGEMKMMKEQWAAESAKSGKRKR